jgi:hypothetical protein
MQIDIKLAICASFVQIALKTDQKNVLTKISIFVHITIDFAAKCSHIYAGENAGKHSRVFTSLTPGKATTMSYHFAACSAQKEGIKDVKTAA